MNDRILSNINEALNANTQISQRIDNRLSFLMSNTVKGSAITAESLVKLRNDVEQSNNNLKKNAEVAKTLSSLNLTLATAAVFYDNAMAFESDGKDNLNDSQMKFFEDHYHQIDELAAMAPWGRDVNDLIANIKSSFTPSTDGEKIKVENIEQSNDIENKIAETQTVVDEFDMYNILPDADDGWA